MPNFQDRVIQGAGTRGNVGTYKAESLPNIRGRLHLGYGGDRDCSGAFINPEKNDSNFPSESNAFGWRLYFSANASSLTYQDGAPVQPNALLIQCCIKY